MKNMILIGIALVALIVFIGIGMSTEKGSTETRSGDFMSMYKNAGNAVLVDIRTKDEFDSGYVTGAINIDFYDTAFLEKMKTLGTGKNFFIYCRSGNRSGQALSMLAQAGITAHHLEGGIASHPELLK